MSAMMLIEKDLYRHTWTYDLNGTSNGERSAFCEKSEFTHRSIRAALGRGPGGGPALPPLMKGRGDSPEKRVTLRALDAGIPVPLYRLEGQRSYLVEARGGLGTTARSDG